ncbi:MAG: hypothetical protein QM793_13840 [Muricomes sp.]
MLILFILILPALLQSLLKLSPVGLFLMQIDPVACCFKMMTDILTDKVPFLSLIGYLIPMLVFAALSVIFLVYASKRISLKGGEAI